MDDAVALAAAAARVEIAPATGGAIASFTFDGQHVLRPTPPASDDVRGHACWPLVPYSNRIADARFTFAGRACALARNFGEHPHSIHGVGWQRPWTVAVRDATRARLVLDHRADGDAAMRAWPWPFRAAQSFSLRATGREAVLTIRLTLANPGREPFPFGLGFHPFFVRTPATRLAFRAGGVWSTDATLLPTKLEPALRGRIVRRWRARSAPQRSTTCSPSGTGAQPCATRVGASTWRLPPIAPPRFLVVYAPARGDAIALEPATHMTDAFNRAARGERDTGTRTLRPGAAFSCTMEIAVHRLP